MQLSEAERISSELFCRTAEAVTKEGIPSLLTKGYFHCLLGWEIGTCWHKMTELYVLESKNGKK